MIFVDTTSFENLFEEFYSSKSFKVLTNIRRDIKATTDDVINRPAKTSIRETNMHFIINKIRKL